MCKYSLEGYAFRDAKEGETLIVGVHYAGHPGTLTPKGEWRTLACVKHGQKLTFENMQFKFSAHFYKSDMDPSERDFYRSLRNANTRLYRNKLKGKRHVVTMLDGGIIETGYDMIMFDNGVVMMLSNVETGTEAYVGVKPTLEDKLHLDEASLRAVAADDPKDKPQPEDEEKEQEEEEKKPDDTAATTAKSPARVHHRLRVHPRDDFRF